MSFDEDAPDLATANKMVVKDIETYMEKLKNYRAPVPPGATKAIVEKLINSQYLTNFYRKLNDKIVQVDFSFSGTVVQGTSVNSVGDAWRMKFTIDADVPPAGSKQKPHIGYEISLDGTKKQVGHKFFTDLTIGRPGLGVDLVECDREESKAKLPNGDTMEWSFQISLPRQLPSSQSIPAATLPPSISSSNTISILDKCSLYDDLLYYDSPSITNEKIQCAWTSTNYRYKRQRRVRNHPSRLSNTVKYRARRMRLHHKKKWLKKFHEKIKRRGKLVEMGNAIILGKAEHYVKRELEKAKFYGYRVSPVYDQIRDDINRLKIE